MSTISMWKEGRDEVVVDLERGRLLQVRIGGHAAFWENPNWSGDWNVGGDRLWVGPEIAWFWRNTDKVDFLNHHVPPGIDSDNWTVIEQTSHFCRIRKVAEVHHLREDRFIKCEIVRELEIIPRAPSGSRDSSITVRTVNRLSVLDGTPATPLDLWFLTQIPAGGHVFLPIRQNTGLRDYFTPISDRLWHRNDGCLQLEINGKNLYKAGLPPKSVTGDMIYRRRVSGDRYLLIHRQFQPVPGRRYCDVPLSEIYGEGDAVQVFNDGGDFGGYGEMEYHSPAIYVSEGPQILDDRNTTTVQLIDMSEWKAWIKGVLSQKSELIGEF